MNSFKIFEDTTVFFRLPYIFKDTQKSCFQGNYNILFFQVKQVATFYGYIAFLKIVLSNQQKVVSSKILIHPHIGALFIKGILFQYVMLYSAIFKIFEDTNRLFGDQKCTIYLHCLLLEHRHAPLSTWLFHHPDSPFFSQILFPIRIIRRV